MSGATELAAPDQNRLYGFDAVRGLAAVAVVVLHAAYAYAEFPLPGLIWPVPLDEPNVVADAMFWWIEGSIMPLFFALSGYFLARSLARQEPSVVLAGRSRRLLLPMMTIGVAVLVIDFQVWSFGLISTEQATFREWRRMKFAPEIQADLFGPAHLWYVEYLWLLCLGVCGIVWVGRLLHPRRADGPAHRPAGHLTTAGIVAVIFAVAALLSFHPEIVLGFQHGWLPAGPKFVHAGLFLLFGMLLARNRQITDQMRRFAVPLVIAAAGIFFLLLPRIHQAMRNGRNGEFDPLLGGLLAIFAITATIGQIGAGLRWFDRPSPTLARLAAASFWIYLVHHPLLGLAQIALRPVPLPPVVKFAAVAAITLLGCLFTYRRFVEGGVIERLLDGEWPWRAFRKSEPVVVPLPVEPVTLRKAA